ncbi:MULTISPECIES: hypothetical protein [Cyanophyceae]|uniref:hypothetical protein n=1 Tax=Cyanophyceae TaxID=3028117 RepID=UPI002FCEDFEF
MPHISNQARFNPPTINGKLLKAIGACYNQQKAVLRSKLPSDRTTYQKIQKLTHKLALPHG